MVGGRQVRPVGNLNVDGANGGVYNEPKLNGVVRLASGGRP